MPGPRAKKNTAKKNKHKGSTSLASQLNGLQKGDWDEVARVLCDHLQLPDLMTRSGLKKVYHCFGEIYRRTEDLYVTYKNNQVVRGGVVAIYVEMCADSILRNMLFRQEFLEKIVELIDQPNSVHLALKAFATISKHGGVDIRRGIFLQAPVITRVLQDLPDDMYAAELAISAIAHAVSCALDEPQKPNYVKVLHLSQLVPLVLGFVGKPDASLPLIHHTLELFGQLTCHCPNECLAFPDMLDFLVAFIRSADMHSRFYVLASLIRVKVPPPAKMVGDPHALLNAVQRGLPRRLQDRLDAYGLTRCEINMQFRCSVAYQNAMLQCAKDHDLYKLGLKLAELIPQNEFVISEGGFRAINARTGEPVFMDVGLPFKLWVDALPFCAEAIRERGKAAEVCLADMLDMKFFVIRSRVPEAIVVAKQGIQRDPSSPYPYYIMALGNDLEEGLRYAKKGLKCTKNMTPFVNYALRARATELAGNLAVSHMQEAVAGDRQWEQSQAFMTSALDDAQIYLSQAPPDMRHHRNVLHWYIALTLVKKGPELSTDLRELENHRDLLKIAQEFITELGTIASETPLRFALERIFSRYAAATSTWGATIAQLNVDNIDKYILSCDKAEDCLAAWLHNVKLEDGDMDRQGEAWQGSRCDPAELHRCSWCGNPSAVLRKCAGCGNARYCDADCQKSGWAEHKVECKSRKGAGSSG